MKGRARLIDTAHWESQITHKPWWTGGLLSPFLEGPLFICLVGPNDLKALPEF